MSQRLRDLAWPEVRDRVASGAVLAVPLGSTEQHGPHLPLSTDSDVAEALCERLAAVRPDVLVAPGVPYGASGEHAGFAGTLSIGAEALELLVLELGRSAAETFPRIVLVSAHGGNAPAVRRAVERLRVESRDVRLFLPHWNGDAHAGRTETSIQLALRPDTVRLSHATAGETRPVAELMPSLRAGGLLAVTPNGVLGDPAGASAIEGSTILDTLTGRLAADLTTWWPLTASSSNSGSAVEGSSGESWGRRAPGSRGDRCRAGIGAATVRALAAEGCAVVAVDLAADDPALPYPLGTKAELDAVVSSAGSGRVLAHVADVRDPDALAAAVTLAQEHFGGLDVAVAAAGVMAGGVPQWEVSPEQERAVLEINLQGVLNLARAAVPAMLARPEPRTGRFVAIASAAATRGLPMLAAYCAAKAGVGGLVRALAVELAGSGITVNAVSPGSTDTAILAESARLYGLDSAQDFAAQQPVQRLLAADEIAAVITFLASTASSAVTGAVLPADGGLAL